MSSPAQSLSPLVVLAAGRSSRLGFPKGLVRVEGMPWLERQLRSYAACGGDRACVVLGHDLDVYRASLPWLDAARRAAIRRFGLELRAAVNPEPDRGMRSSLDLGLAELAAEGSVFVLPVDCPAPSELWARLERAEGDAVVPTHGGRGGHPVRLGESVRAALRRSDAPLNEVLRSCAVRRLEVDDPSVVTNLNGREQWERWLGGPAEPASPRRPP